ncbi:putative uncharacterized protein DDB_G0267716 [Pistacia vera]|uniref:putative uncharacterized protein DDB_G0267716 n=1 Tax=Pistacia vera TaxID=55513 RepID=UPI0012633A8B|nr:putative uncharacterized protein DDB_G0267716 [Pistacia vera]
MAAITPSRITRTATITKDDQQNDPDYDLKNDNDDDEDEDKDDKLPLSQEDVNNFMATLLLRRNKQFLGHRLHPTAIEIRNINCSTTIRPARLDNESSVAHLRDMSIAVLRELRGFSLDNEDINPDNNNNAQQNNPNDNQQNNPDYDLKDDNEDKEDEDKDDKALPTNQVQRMLGDMSIAVLRELKDFSLDNDNINPLGVFISALTTNQVPRMLRDMSIAILRELRGFSLDNDNISPNGANNAQQNNSDGIKNEGRPAK